MDLNVPQLYWLSHYLTWQQTRHTPGKKATKLLNWCTSDSIAPIIAWCSSILSWLSDSGSCSPSVYLMIFQRSQYMTKNRVLWVIWLTKIVFLAINRVCWKINSVSIHLVDVFLFSMYSMFSMFSHSDSGWQEDTICGTLLVRHSHGRCKAAKDTVICKVILYHDSFKDLETFIHKIVKPL